MRNKFERLLLLGFSTLFLFMYFSGEIALYIHPRFHILTLITGFVLLGLAVARWLLPIHSCGCSQFHPGFYGVFIVPLILALILPTQALDAGLANMRGINLEPPMMSVPAWSAPAFGSIQMRDDEYMKIYANLYSDPSKYRGRVMETIGFVLQPGKYGPQNFVAARYAVWCCIADATPVGFLCHWDGEIPPENQWVRVVGKILPEIFNDTLIPVLMIEKLELIEAPSWPYVFVK